MLSGSTNVRHSEHFEFSQTWMRHNAGRQEAPRRGAPHTASGIARHNLFLNEILNEKVLPFSFTIEEVGAFTLPDRKHNATEIAPLCI